MHDLTPKVYKVCSKKKFFYTSVIGSKGNAYEIVYGKMPEHCSYEYGLRCSCPAFKYSKDCTCKHIKSIEHELCQWHEFTSDEPCVDGKCPLCGSELEGETWMI